MAQVQIAVADVQVAIEDEDKSAKVLQRLAVQTVEELVGIFGLKSPDEPLAEEEDAEVYCSKCLAGLLSSEHLEKCGED